MGSRVSEAETVYAIKMVLTGVDLIWFASVKVNIISLWINISIKSYIILCHILQSLKSLTLTAINGGWSEWSEWSTCSASCGGGSRMRSRTCNHPVPSHGGADCANDKSSLAEERQQCGESSCTQGEQKSKC